MSQSGAISQSMEIDCRLDLTFSQCESIFSITKLGGVYMEKRYVGTKELSKMLGMKELRLRKKVTLKQIPYIKDERLVLFDLKDIEKWLDAKRVYPEKWE